MRKQCIGNTLILILVFSLDSGFAQDKKIDKFRVGGGSASATQMSLWLAKEGNYYEKNGLSVEAISIPGSSLALQAICRSFSWAAPHRSRPTFPGLTRSLSPPSCANFFSGFLPSQISSGWKI